MNTVSISVSASASVSSVKKLVLSADLQLTFVMQEKCTISYNGNGQTDWYAVALTLEDFPTSTSDFSNANALSKVGLQFLVHIAHYSGLCSRKPFMTGSSPADGSCVEIPTDEVYQFSLEAKHLDSSKP